ncbi:hypothetical protein HYH02_007567 [Chlamydomonas schloesseri]|uniref:Cyclin-like domain-containing protein n=1 Tax=Chlamydomonas schloesseri TaxID=2026947 RepID=A0A835WI34_9CHLO|nr:hypothetical protein HYH02_007567 [Chlamydomonas schloesseri]|eukprot:KAG2447649.1 hypothetical protein HYH02_007567 [Chlamydomonas schloesseri]
MAFHGFNQPGESIVIEGGYGEEHAQRTPDLSQQRAMLREQEHRQDLTMEKTRKMSKFKFRTLEDLRNHNPSIRDGLEPDKERMWRRQYCKLIQDAGVAMRVPQWGIAVGITLCHRFFAVKSMKRNDRFLIATACLFLAAKVEEAPRLLKNVISEVERVRHSKDPVKQRELDDPAKMERYREEVLQAERAVLYTLGFDLDVQHPYTMLLEWLNKERLLDEPPGSPFKPLVQNSWNLVNDSLRTTLCLQFPPPKIAAAALWLADVMNTDDEGRHHSRMPQGRGFFEQLQISPDELTSIADQMLSEYENSKLRQLAAAQGVPLPQARAEAEARLGPSHLGAGGRLLGAGAAAGGRGPAARAEAGPARMEVEEEGEVKD